VVGGADDHRIDVGPGEQLAEIVVGGAALVRAALGGVGIFLIDRLLGGLAALGIDVADRQHLRFLGVQAEADMAARLDAHADEADAQAIGGGIFFLVAQRRARNDERHGCRGRLDKGPASDA
jgi:hypothetical protein